MNLGPDYAWLRPSEVRVDEAVQRRFDATHANRIAKSYDPALFGLGHASLRGDGRHYALDGQHRVTAANESGHGDIPVLFKVYRGLTREAEADLFLKLNGNKKSVNALDRFNVAVKASHPIETSIVRILSSFGLRIAAYRADGGVAAVNSLLQIYHAYIGSKPAAGRPGSALPDGQLLSRTLHVLTKAWGKERDAFDALLMKGVAAFLAKHGTTVDGTRLAQSIAKKANPVATVGNIRAYAHSAGKAPIHAAVEYFENIYNRRRPASKRIGK